MKNNKLLLIFGILGSIILFIIIFPIIKIFFACKMPYLKEALIDREVISSILVTFESAFYASIFGLLFGVPLAYVFARASFRGKFLLEGLVDIPIIIPHAAAGIALLGVFGKKFFIGSFFYKFGISFIGTKWGISLAMFFVSVPFLINGAKEGFRLVDSRLESVAMTFGASRMKSFFDITLPLAFKSILSGFIMMWARGISEFGAVIILAYHPMTVSVKIFEKFESYGLAYSRPVAVLLIFVCLFIFIILRLLVNSKKDKNA